MTSIYQNKKLFLFLFFSLLWSFLWFQNKEFAYSFVDNIPSLSFYFLGITPAIGLFLSALFLRKNDLDIDIKLGGNSFYKSLLIIATPILVLAIVGVDNTIDLSPNIFGAIIGMLTMTYALFEEFGWRGYLQEKLEKRFNKWVVYLIVGLVWYLWHWYFLRPGNHPKLIMIPILIVGSFGIGEVARSTKSILICAALHGLGNILIIYGVIAHNISTPKKLIVLGTALIVWIPMIKLIEKENSADFNDTK